MGREKEPSEDGITKRLPDAEIDTLEMPQEPLIIQRTAPENNIAEVERLRLQLQRSIEREQLLKDEIVEAKYKTGELTDTQNLTDEMNQILQLIANSQNDDQMWYITESLEMHAVRVYDILTTLRTSGLVKSNRVALGGEPIHELTEKGIKILIRNNLI